MYFHRFKELQDIGFLLTFPPFSIVGVSND